LDRNVRAPLNRSKRGVNENSMREILIFRVCTLALMLWPMSNMSESPLDRLWREYSAVFRDFDDLTLARWLAQTLGQLEGHAWRLSHPLLGAYRLGTKVAHDRQIWFKHLATAPAAHGEAPCCRAPLLPLLTRYVLEIGLVINHCVDT